MFDEIVIMNEIFEVNYCRSLEWIFQKYNIYNMKINTVLLYSENIKL